MATDTGRRMSDAKATVKAGGLSIGSWLTLGHTAVAEIMARAGFDWLAIDLEHSVIGIETVQPMIQAIELGGSVPLVRLTANDAALAKRVADAGACGIIVPMVNTPQEAEAAVQAIKYPPRGRRGVGLARAQGYGTTFSEYFHSINDRSLVVVQIEHRQGVENIEDILAVDGIDAIFLGPYDLSGSYGVAGELDHPIVKAAEKQVVAAARRAGVAAGIHIVHPSIAELRRRVAEGFRFIAYGVDMLYLGDAARAAIGSAREVLPELGG